MASASIRLAGSRNLFTILHRIKSDDGFAPNLARMSTQSAPPPPNGPNFEPPSSPKKNYAGIMAAVGGFLACGGIGYIYKTYTDNEKFGVLSDQKKWTLGKFGWQEQTKFHIPEVTLNKLYASCAPKEDCAPKCEDSSCLRILDKEEELISRANGELEKALREVKGKAVEATEVALKAYCETTDIIKLFMDKVYCALSQDNMESPRFEEVWCDVYETALKRCEKVIDAMRKGQCAWELICRLREIIENGKACKYTQCNPLLLTAEESILCAERELLNAKSRMECVQSDSPLVEQYRALIEDFRSDLKAELDSKTAGNSECKGTFGDNECVTILSYAYKKVLRIQMELGQIQVCNGRVPPNQQKTLC